MDLKNHFIEVLSQAHGQKVKKFFEDRGISNNLSFTANKLDDDVYRFYGLLNHGIIDNISYQYLNELNGVTLTLEEMEEKFPIKQIEEKYGFKTGDIVKPPIEDNHVHSFKYHVLSSKWKTGGNLTCLSGKATVIGFEKDFVIIQWIDSVGKGSNAAFKPEQLTLISTTTEHPVFKVGDVVKVPLNGEGEVEDYIYHDLSPKWQEDAGGLSCPLKQGTVIGFEGDLVVVQWIDKEENESNGGFRPQQLELVSNISQTQTVNMAQSEKKDIMFLIGEYIESRDIDMYKNVRHLDHLCEIIKDYVEAKDSINFIVYDPNKKIVYQFIDMDPEDDSVDCFLYNSLTAEDDKEYFLNTKFELFNFHNQIVFVSNSYSVLNKLITFICQTEQSLLVSPQSPPVSSLPKDQILSLIEEVETPAETNTLQNKSLFTF